MSTYLRFINEMYINGFESSEDEPTFRVPENFDCYNEGSGWQAYRGGNDWEQGTTGVAVYLNPSGYNKEMARIWFEVAFPPHLQEYVSSTKSPSAPSSQAVKKWGDRATRRWMRETINIRRSTRQKHGVHDGYNREWTERKSWKKCFMLALETERMKPFVKKWGVDKTKWVGMKRSQQPLMENGQPSKYWWMDKKGNLIPVAQLGHGPAGRDILKRLGVESENTYSEMYARGYIRVGFAGLWGQYHIEINYNRSNPPSATQWRALKDLAIEMGADSIEDDARGGKIRVDESRLLFENFHENKEWFLYEGDNTLTAVFEDNSRQTFKIHFHEKRLREDREKHRKKAASTWKRLAMEIRKNAGLNKVGNPVTIPWQECFQKALEDPMMLEFVDDLRSVPIFESWIPMQNFWLSPNGDARRVASHERGASEILASLGKRVGAGYREAYDAMYRLGWARVIIGDNNHPLIIDTGKDTEARLTKAQRQWVEEKSFGLGLNGEYSNAYGRTLHLESNELCEMTYDELRNSMKKYRSASDIRNGTRTGSDSRERGATQVSTKSLRIVSTVGLDGEEHDTLMFSYKSRNPNSGDPRSVKPRWNGYLRFRNPKDSPVAKVESEMDCEVNCSCPDYKYVWAKANSDHDAGVTGNSTGGGGVSAKPLQQKKVNIFEAEDPVVSNVDKRWKMQGNTNNGTYGKRIRNPENTPGLCKHLIALAKYIDEKREPEEIAPVDPNKKEPSVVAPVSKLKNTGKPVNIFESLKRFAEANPSFDVPYED